MKKTISSRLVVFAMGSLVATQALAAGTIAGYGAAGSSNPMIAAVPVTPSATDPGATSPGAGAAGQSAGLSTTAIVTTTVIVAAAATAIAVGASSGSGNSSPSHH